jgi:hypothetical protein
MARARLRVSFLGLGAGVSTPRVFFRGPQTAKVLPASLGYRGCAAMTHEMPGATVNSETRSLAWGR